MSEGFKTLEGWYTLHDFRSFDWRVWNASSHEQKLEFRAALKLFLSKHDAISERREGSFGFFDIVGHKSDFLFLHLRSSLEELAQIEREFNCTSLQRYMTRSYSYVSVVELSNYVVAGEQNLEAQKMIEARLKPKLPTTKHICFYPMNKRRNGDDNWYMQPLEERRRMMKSHGLLGRQYAGRVVQMIGGSMGLDDWEWGVTLFADDPLTFKHLVTDMRFDEVSARFAEFGAFYVGNRLSALDVIP